MQSIIHSTLTHSETCMLLRREEWLGKTSGYLMDICLEHGSKYELVMTRKSSFFWRVKGEETSKPYFGAIKKCRWNYRKLRLKREICPCAQVAEPSPDQSALVQYERLSPIVGNARCQRISDWGQWMEKAVFPMPVEEEEKEKKEKNIRSFRGNTTLGSIGHGHGTKPGKRALLGLGLTMVTLERGSLD